MKQYAITKSPRGGYFVKNVYTNVKYSLRPLTMQKAKALLVELQLGWKPAGESMHSKKWKFTHFNMTNQKGPDARRVRR